jgi:hypothetical protein
MIHEGGDNYADAPKPLGGGGARIACGVIPGKAKAAAAAAPAGHEGHGAHGAPAAPADPTKAAETKPPR